MSTTWLLILLTMIGGNFILNIIPGYFFIEGVIGINLFILAISYFLFRRDPFIDVRVNSLFMLGLTVINILTELGIMSSTMSWIAFAALFIWSFLGGGRSN